MKHEHCDSCFRTNCLTKPDGVAACDLVYCPAGCVTRLHTCKLEDHKLICWKEKVNCINYVNGCPLQIVRDKMSAHLPVCPASVILCPREWNRWPMHSQEKGWKAPMPFRNPHVICGQLDVAFALRDQKMLMESFQTPRKTRRLLRNALTQHYPAVPIQSFSSAVESPSSDTSELSDDESGTPWDLTQSPPGLQRTISNQLSSTATTKNMHNTTLQEAKKINYELDYVTGKQGLKRLSEIMRKKESANEMEQKAEQLCEKLESSNLHDFNVGSEYSEAIKKSLTVKTYAEDEDEFDIYCAEKKLFEVLGLDLNMQFISSYQAKPLKMFTFLCGQEFRRDEYISHSKNFHSDIQYNLNNWFEQRCPLAYLGCTFAFQRLKPKNPSGAIVFSQILQSVGLSKSEEFDSNIERSNMKLTDDEDIRTVVGRSRLREATPEIHTSYKCDSVVSVIPRYRSVSREASPVKAHLDHHVQLLTDLPFEVLQKIAMSLDNFSLQHLSMTCKQMQSLCCSLLDRRGIVSLVWEKNTQVDSPPFWNVAYKKWHFSTSFTPVEDWTFKHESPPLLAHLSTCPYNQDADKNIKHEPFQMIYDFAGEEEYSLGRDMFDKRKNASK